MFNCIKKAFYTHVAHTQTSSQIARFGRDYGAYKPEILGAFANWPVKDLFNSRTRNLDLKHVQQQYATEVYRLIRDKQKAQHRAFVDVQFEELIERLHSSFDRIVEVVPMHVPAKRGNYFKFSASNAVI
jgi:hypothetical protein